MAWTAPIALVAVFAVALVGAAMIGAVATLFGASFDSPPPAVNILATVFQDAAFVGVALVFARMTERVVPEHFGIRRTALWPAVRWSALVVVAFYLTSGLWASLINITEPDKLPDSLGVDRSTVALVAACVLVTVIAPIAEEFFFRGFFFTALWTWCGPLLAAVLTGIVFGAIHAGSADVEFLVPLAVLGFLLCVLRWRTGSLLPCMAVHALNNSIAFGANQVDWNVWQVVLLIVGSNAVILALMWPLTRRTWAPPAREAA